MQESVEYLGHIIDAAGIRATHEKAAAIVKAPSPEKVTQAQVLSLLNYYCSSCLTVPFQKDRKWLWSKECEKAMSEAKALLMNSNMMQHFP